MADRSNVVQDEMKLRTHASWERASSPPPAAARAAARHAPWLGLTLGPTPTLALALTLALTLTLTFGLTWQACARCGPRS